MGCSAISVVTSCSAAGWRAYGRRFVETFGQHWPAEVRPLLYTEDALDDLQPRLAGLPILSLFDASPAARAFAERHRGSARAHGKERRQMDVGWTPNKVRGGHNFRYDAFRFAKKVFAVEAAAREVGGGRLFWVDADVVTFAPVPPALLDELLPLTAAISALLRDGAPTETGFVGYDLDQEACRAFIAELERLYASDEVFALQEWHDGWVFEWLRKKMGVPTHAIPHCSRRQPFINSRLGEFLDHTKGRNKALGRTPKELRLVRDEVAYWR